MFIRVKWIKNQPYAYRVSNRWRKRKGTKQEIKGYLGRVYYLNPVKELSFDEFIGNNMAEYLKNNSARAIILDLIRYELLKHGFTYKGKNKNILFYTNESINPAKSESLEKNNLKSESSEKNNVEIKIEDNFNSNLIENQKENENKQEYKIQNISKSESSRIKVELAPSILSIRDTKKPIALALNNDYLCNYTLRELAKFKSHSEEEECGKELAKAFISAGIPVIPSLFIEIFNKIYSPRGSYVQ